MNEQEARTIAAQATGTLIAQYAEAVQLGENWVVVIATKAKASDNTMPSYQVFGSRMEWNAATYTRHASHLGAYALYSPSQQVAVLYIDNQPANTNTLHFQTMPTAKEVGKCRGKPGFMHAAGMHQLAELWVCLNGLFVAKCLASSEQGHLNQRSPVPILIRQAQKIRNVWPIFMRSVWEVGCLCHSAGFLYVITSADTTDRPLKIHSSFSFM